jgi:hypothetical protein
MRRFRPLRRHEECTNAPTACMAGAYVLRAPGFLHKPRVFVPARAAVDVRTRNGVPSVPAPAALAATTIGSELCPQDRPSQSHAEERDERLRKLPRGTSITTRVRRPRDRRRAAWREHRMSRCAEPDDGLSGHSVIWQRCRAANGLVARLLRPVARMVAT